MDNGFRKIVKYAYKAALLYIVRDKIWRNCMNGQNIPGFQKAEMLSCSDSFFSDAFF